MTRDSDGSEAKRAEAGVQEGGGGRISVEAKLPLQYVPHFLDCR